MSIIKQFVVRLSEDEHEKLKHISFEKNVSIQKMFNDMVQKYLKEYDEEKKLHTITLPTVPDEDDTVPQVKELSKALKIVGQQMEELATSLLKKDKKE